MGLAVHFATPLICALIFRHFLRQPGGWAFLEGLYTFMPHTAPIPTPPPGAKTTKKDRKLMQKRQLTLKNAGQTLTMQQLSLAGLMHVYKEPATFGSSFETLGVLLLVLCVGTAIHFTLGPLFGLWQDVLIWSLCPLLVLWAVVLLALLDGGGSLLALLARRPHVAALGMAGAAGAYLLLVAAPQEWFAWDVAAAARDLEELVNGGVTRALRLRMPNARPPPPVHFTADGVALGVAAVAGFLTAVTVSPAARIARLYTYVSPVPYWAKKYLSPNPAVQFLLVLSLALPASVVLYGIKPLVDYWEVPAAAVAAAGPILVSLAAVAQILAVRPLVGAHLGSGLLEWHLVRHDTGGPGANNTNQVAAREAVVRKRLLHVYATVCQVALQVLAPAAILVSLALMYGAASGQWAAVLPDKPLVFDMSAMRRANATATAPVVNATLAAAAEAGADAAGGLEGMDAGEAVDAAAAAVGAAVGSLAGAVPPMPTLGFLRFAAGFLAWWQCLLLVAFCYPMLLVYRTGLNLG